MLPSSTTQRLRAQEWDNEISHLQQEPSNRPAGAAEAASDVIAVRVIAASQRVPA